MVLEKEVINLPIVRITWRAGKSQEQKERIAKGMVDLICKTLNFTPDRVTIIFEDIPEKDVVTF